MTLSGELDVGIDWSARLERRKVKEQMGVGINTALMEGLCRTAQDGRAPHDSATYITKRTIFPKASVMSPWPASCLESLRGSEKCFRVLVYESGA